MVWDLTIYYPIAFCYVNIFFFGRVIPLCPFAYITHLAKKFPSHPSTPKKLSIFNVNGVICYFSQNVILQRCHHVKGRNIDVNKMGARVGVQHFLSQAFKRHYIVIWSCILQEDVMEILRMLSHKYLLINLFSFPRL